MRKKLLTLATAFGLTVPMFASMNMYVKQKDGKIVSFDVENVEEVYYGMGDSPIIETPAVDAASSDLRYFILNDNEVEVTGFINGSANIVVPARVTISGKTYIVTSIGKGAFEEQTRIKTVTLPNTIKIIGESAFEDCENLTSINIPSSVTVIEEDAFAGCEKLTNVSLNEGLTTIGGWAFDGCSSFTSIKIPSSVNFIGANAFLNTDNIEPGVLIYDNGTKCYGVIGDREKITEVVIPEGVISIGDKAFSFDEWECNLSRVVIPSTVTLIGNRAFEYCRSLNNINVPSSVTEIGEGAFYYCTNADVVVDNTLDNIKFYDYDDIAVSYDKSNAFEGCKSVKFNNGILAGENSTIVESEYLNVVEGGKYVVYNPSIDGGELKFEVLRVSGSAGDKVVEFKVYLDGDDADGKTFVLGDDADHCSYFGRVNGQLGTLRQAVAVANAKDVIFALSSSADSYMITSATVNNRVKEAGALVSRFGTLTTFGSSNTDQDNTDIEKIDSAEEIQVKAGGTYYASNYIKDFTFKIKSVSGNYLDKNQVVEFEINGETFVLSDAGSSYLMWTGERFEAVGKRIADVNAESVVMILACANSSADYTFVSPTHNATLYSMGARKTLFSNYQNDSEVQTSYDEIQVKVGGTYYASNPIKDFTFKVMAVSGHYVDQSQVVIIEIDGVEYELSDAGNSFLIWTGENFVTANTSSARNSARKVVACLSLVNSEADYTLMSATKNNTLKSLGAVQTLFSTTSDQISQPVEATTSISPRVGDEYWVSNNKLGLSKQLLTIDNIGETTITLTIADQTITIGSAAADKSYAVFYANNGVLKAASMSDAKANAESVLFICKSGAILASGTLANSYDIYSNAGETTFVKR